MKKLFLIPLLVLSLASCTTSNKNDTSFNALYQANVHSQVASLDEFSTLIGLNRHESIEGTIRSSVNVPGFFSGNLTSQYTGLIDGRNSESFFRNVRVLFTSLMSSGSLSADEIGLISHGADSYVSYKNLADADMMTDAIKTVLKKYENSWLSLSDQANLDMSSEELMGYNIGRNLFMKSLTDLEKYATDYPIFKETNDLGMSGSLHLWSVELDRAHIIDLSKKLTKDFTGTGMSDADSALLKQNLETLSFSGKIGFDPSHPQISLLDGSLSLSGQLMAQVSIKRQENGGQILVSNPQEKVSMELNYGKKDNRYTIDGTLRQAETDMGKMSGYIERVDGKLRDISLDISAQGMSITLRHTVDGDKFTGKLSAVVGTLEWSGTLGADTLKSLKVNGTAPFGSLSINLAEGENGMTRGPVVVKSGKDTLVDATLALKAAKEQFAIILDVISKDFPIHFDLDISAKSTHSDKKVTVPTSHQSIQKLIQEMDAITNTPFTESGSLPTDSAQ